MLEYILKNKDWIFSGAGVTVLVLIGAYFLKGSKKEHDPESVFGIVDTPKRSLVSHYSLVPNFILKWRFMESRMNSMINIDIRSQGESINLNLGELPDCRLWVQVVNHSPFDLDIENIKGELNYNGCRVSIETKEHVNVSKHSTNKTILLEGVLTGEQAKHCSKDSEAPYTSLTLSSRINTKFGVFKNYSGDMQYLHINIINKRDL